MSLVDVTPTAGTTRDDVLRRAAAVEAGSEHPVARAVVAAARGLEVPPVSAFRSSGGLGVDGVVDGVQVVVGRASWLAERGLTVPASLREAIEAAPKSRGWRMRARIGDRMRW
jgi:Cu+-exporting ATPase